LSQAMTPRSQNHSRPPSMTSYDVRRQSTTQAKPVSDDFMRDTMYTEMMFGSPAPDNLARLNKGPKRADIRWGSDAGFHNGQNFIAPSNQETVEAVERKLANRVEVFEAQSSASTTRQPSPVVTRHTELTQQKHTRGPEVVGDEDEQDPRPKKRRKGKMKEEDDDEDEAGPSPTKASRKRKHKAPTSIPETTQSPPPSGKRRKSANAAAAAKAARENLTEDQKRENHIKSEQKRRTLIKEGFDDLGELVPDLRGGGFSKSAVLIMAGDWLEDLIKGNIELSSQLAELEAAKGLS